MSKTKAIITTGIATFFFGFGAGAILNLYLISIHSPLVANLRSSLSFKSSIYGDGILLPIVNMIMIAFLYDNKKFVNRKTLSFGFLGGGAITAWFHINQAVQGLVNWTMPTPWHWNVLGIWHAAYMFSVTSLISLFVIVSVSSTIENKKLSKSFVVVALGLLFFLFLLRLDYSSVNLASLVPHKL